MKLLSVGLARTICFLDINELNPGGKDIYTHVVPAVVEKYKFKTHPKPSDDLAQGMKFTNGEFAKEDGTVLAVNFTVFSDGIAADTFSSTTDSEKVLQQVLSGLPSLGFAYDAEMVRRKSYLSQVTVKCSKPLFTLNPKLADFAKHLSSESGGTAFEFSALEFWPDQTLSVKPANFSFQRKVGEPPNSDRYWSQAGLPTEKHLEFLEELERTLS